MSKCFCQDIAIENIYCNVCIDELLDFIDKNLEFIDYKTCILCRVEIEHVFLKSYVDVYFCKKCYNRKLTIRNMKLIIFNQYNGLYFRL